MASRAPLVLALWVLFSAPAARASVPHHDTINAIAGDASWIAAHGAPPDARASEDDRIRTHLLWVEARLRAAPVTHLDPGPRASRARMLDALHAYALAGAFPRHEGPVSARTPRFVDHRGNLCAVGYLIALTEGLGATLALNAAHEHEYVMEMREPALDAWAARHGFTRRELASIQPSYDWIEDPRPRPEPDPAPSRVATQADLDRVLRDADPRIFACLPSPLRATTRLTVRAFVRPSRGPDAAWARLHVVVDARPADAALARCVERAVMVHGGAIRGLAAPRRGLRAVRRIVLRRGDD